MALLIIRIGSGVYYTIIIIRKVARHSAWLESSFVSGFGRYLLF